ncbi:MAG: GerMN domain-containing protein [Lachnospiraceae bacterium]|nr:GerMN domain-containing protein [Lachnospiraceae bacterium]
MKKISFFGVIVLALLLLGGCGKDADAESDYYIYYMNNDKTKIVMQPYELKTDADASTEVLIEEMLDVLATDVDSVEYVKPIPKGVEVESFQMEGSQLSLYWNDSYSQMSVSDEVLCRAAVVKTMAQLPGVTCVSFYVGDAPLTNSKGALVGLMTAESFVENPGEQINAIQSTVLHLYFANETGDALVEEDREVQYSSNVSMEKLVVEHLIKGPETPGLKGTIPSGTNLINVSTTNGVCYVNFDEGFYNQNYEIQEAIVIYSIVNSLSELSNINKVQISVNGNSNGVYRDTFGLDKQYERKLDYVQSMEQEVLSTEGEEGAD